MKGSTWHRWDLHYHTPSSYDHHNKSKTNQEIVAVIGEKGSGKTALLDMVAHALGTKQEDSSSFLQRAKSELKNSIIKFNLFGDAVQTISFMDNISTCKCRYINPAKLSSFCEEETSMQDFIKSILLHDEISKENNAILETNLEIQSKILRIGSIDEQLVQLEQVEKMIEELKGKIEIEEKNKPNLPTVDEISKEKFSQLNIAEYRKGSKNGYISYESGSIENPEIRDKICKILEGGKDAFINRERRYNFKL